MKQMSDKMALLRERATTVAATVFMSRMSTLTNNEMDRCMSGIEEGRTNNRVWFKFAPENKQTYDVSARTVSMVLARMAVIRGIQPPSYDAVERAFASAFRPAAGRKAIKRLATGDVAHQQRQRQRQHEDQETESDSDDVQEEEKATESDGDAVHEEQAQEQEHGREQTHARESADMQQRNLMTCLTLMSGMIDVIMKDRDETKDRNRSLKALVKKKNKKIKALLEQVAAKEPSAAQALMIMSRGGGASP